MCFSWLFFKRKSKMIDFVKKFECSCDLCGKNCKNMEELVVHMGYHKIDDINRRLINDYGTVRCNKCWKTFRSVVDLSNHECFQDNSTISDLSRAASCDSLSSVVVHE